MLNFDMANDNKYAPINVNIITIDCIIGEVDIVYNLDVKTEYTTICDRYIPKLNDDIFLTILYSDIVLQ